MLDISPGMLTLAKKQAKIQNLNNIEYLQFSLDEFITEKKYDIIIAVGLLAHVPSVKKTMTKLGKLLEPDGNLIVQFSNYDSLITKLNFLIKKRGYKINSITKSQMEQILVKNSLGIKDYAQYSILFPGIGKLPNRLLYDYTFLTYKNRLLSRFGTDYIWKLHLLK